MDRTIDVRWVLHDREVKLQCKMVGKYFPGTYMQPLEYPEMEIIEGEYANGQPLSKQDYEELIYDGELAVFVEQADYTPLDRHIDNKIEELLQGEL